MREEPRKTAWKACFDLVKHILFAANVTWMFVHRRSGKVWARLIFLTITIGGSARKLVSQRSWERFNLDSEGAGVARSQRVTLNGSGIRSLWLVEGFSRMKPQTSAFYFIHFLWSLWPVWIWDPSSGTRKAFKEASEGGSWGNELLGLGTKIQLGVPWTWGWHGCWRWQWAMGACFLHSQCTELCVDSEDLLGPGLPQSESFTLMSRIYGEKLIWLVVQSVYFYCGWLIFEHMCRVGKGWSVP